MTTITYGDFAKLEICVGVIEEVLDFPEAKNPAYKLHINLGPEIGLRWSSAQIVKYYTKAELLGKQVLCVVNFPPKQIRPFMSEALTLGVPDGEGGCILITPSKQGAQLGGKLY
ncbi:MAG: tRNA-binding protein [Candidatus Pacebacteria bacterium]|nr:tRNA-binding protein [Candidatus Paceibacterota bacterium]